MHRCTLGQLSFHLVEPLDVLELERQCLLAGEPHGEESEAITGHLEGAILSNTEADLGLDLNGPKVRLNGGSGDDELIDGIENVLVCLTKVGRNVPAAGHDCVALDGDDRGDFVASNDKPA